MLEDQTYVKNSYSSSEVGQLPGGLFLSSSAEMFSPGSGGLVSCNYGGGKVVVLEGAGNE
jgi:hypothetical protein